MSRPEESRSNLAVGIEWASRVLTVGLMFVRAAAGRAPSDRGGGRARGPS